jgi:hypothetical protein
MRLRFLFGYDDLDDVKQILSDCRLAKQTGRLLEWTSKNVSTRKAGSIDDLNEIIYAAEIFLRTFDPVLSVSNPIMRRTKPVLFI